MEIKFVLKSEEEQILYEIGDEEGDEEEFYKRHTEIREESDLRELIILILKHRLKFFSMIDLMKKMRSVYKDEYPSLDCSSAVNLKKDLINAISDKIALYLEKLPYKHLNKRVINLLV